MIPALLDTFGRRAFAAVALLALMTPAFAADSQKPAQATAIHGEGCVEAGVEARCLVLRDLKTGRLYDLLFKAARPPVEIGRAHV